MNTQELGELSINAGIVVRFFERWDERDVEGIMALWSPGAVWDNISWQQPLRDAEIRALVEKACGTSAAIRTTVHNIAENGGVVLTERTDRWQPAGGGWATVRVMGAFEVDGGHITAWRDYFDVTQAETSRAAAAGQGGPVDSDEALARIEERLQP